MFVFIPGDISHQAGSAERAHSVGCLIQFSVGRKEELSNEW